jgi:mannitol-1-phosphate 5-dehydrogenase
MQFHASNNGGFLTMKAVVYGGGNIGRGFLGQLLFESGYETVFIDVNRKLIDKLNSDHSYPIKIVCNEYQNEMILRNVRAVHSEDAAEEIATADILFTSAGVNVLPHIAQNIAEGIRGRRGRGLDIVICENLLHADKHLKEWIGQYIRVPENIGFVESSVGRMVPIMKDDMYEGNILRVWVEPFCTLPVDQAAFKNGIPNIKNMLPSAPFAYYIQRKLSLHNTGHAITAYLGL